MGLILIIAAICFTAIGLIVGAVVLDSGYSWSQDDTKWWIIISLVVTGIVIAIAAPSIYFSKRAKTIELETFYTVNAIQYQCEIDMMRNSLPIDDNQIIDATNLAQIQKYQDAVTTYREEVVNYNKELKEYRFWQDHFFEGILIPNVSPEIDYINISDIGE